MPNIKSAEKRVRTTTAKNMHNRMKKSELKTTLRRIREAMEQNDANAQGLLKEAVKKIDQAVAKNLLHKNAASRKKSRLQKAFNKVAVK